MKNVKMFHLCFLHILEDLNIVLKIITRYDFYFNKSQKKETNKMMKSVLWCNSNLSPDLKKYKNMHKRVS